MGLVGCQRNAPPAAPSSSSTGEGIVRGRVLLGGLAPTPHLIPGSPNITDETIVANSNGTLKNVIVYVDNAPASTRPADSEPVVLDQIGCVYVPHVVAVQTGQTLRIKSSDSLMHNVQLQCSANPPANFGFPAPGSRDLVLQNPEAPFRVKCDVHPWMTAWIGVFNHPWFAVTGDDGAFTLSHVPPGQYNLVAWHEALPEQRLPIVVSDSQTTHAEFTFQAP